jgi:hypothetical protein
MKHGTLLLTLLPLAAFAVGCGKTETTSQKLDNVQVQTKETAQAMKDYTFAQKAEFTDTMQSQLAEINKDLDQLSAKIDLSTDAAQAEAKPKLQMLRDQSDKLKQQLDLAKDATESTWESVKSATSKAYDSLKAGFQQSRQWVSDKIAP